MEKVSQHVERKFNGQEMAATHCGGLQVVGNPENA